jgi:hypothetical protein
MSRRFGAWYMIDVDEANCAGTGAGCGGCWTEDDIDIRGDEGENCAGLTALLDGVAIFCLSQGEEG